MTSKVPKNWPQGLPFYTASISHSIPIDDLRILLFPPRYPQFSALIQEGRAHPDLEIQILKKPHLLSDTKTSLGHESRGLFATKYLQKETLLGEYVGVMHLLEEVKKRGNQKLEYSWKISHPHFHLLINAAEGGNELMFVNDYRNIAPRPNVEPLFFPHGQYHYFCYQTCEEVLPGEELLIDYNDHFWR